MGCAALPDGPAWFQSASRVSREADVLQHRVEVGAECSARGPVAEAPEVSGHLSGHPDLQPEVPEPELEQAPAGQVHYPRQQDDDKDDQDNPDNGNHEAREGKSTHFSHSGNAS